MVKLTLRIPDALHVQIVAAAEADQRSLNNEIVVLATQALQARNG